MSLPEEDHPTAFASLTSTAILTKKPPLGIREALRGGPRDSGTSRANNRQALPPPYRWNTWNSDAGRNAKPPHRPDGPDQPARTKPVLAVRKVVHLAKAGGGKAPLQKTSRASVPGHHPSGAEYQGVSFRKGKPPGFSARSGEGLPLNHEQDPKRSPDLGFFLAGSENPPTFQPGAWYPPPLAVRCAQRQRGPPECYFSFSFSPFSSSSFSTLIGARQR